MDNCQEVVEENLEEFVEGDVSFSEKTLLDLAPMCNVVLKPQDDNIIFLTKEGRKFGYIDGEEIYLLSKKNKYIKIDPNYKTNLDILVHKATQAFWVANEK